MDKAPLDMSTEELEDYVAVIGLNDDMYFSLHSSAQSELSALREELAEYQKILASYKNNYVTKLAYNAVQSSLTAAEQRNAELVSLREQVAVQTNCKGPLVQWDGSAWVKAAPVAVVHFICDRVPDQHGCVFIECEDQQGNSINAGKWEDRPDGLAQLVVSLDKVKELNNG